MQDLQLQKEMLINTLKRIDDAVNSVNSKSNFLISFNTFIIGTIILKNKDIINSFDYPKFKYLLPFLLFIILLGCGYSLLKIFEAVNPFLESGNKPSVYHSLIYFGSIANLDSDTFKSQVLKATNESYVDDLSYQIHLLAKGVNKKNLCLLKAMFYMRVLVLVPIGIIAILKVIEWFIV